MKNIYLVPLALILGYANAQNMKPIQSFSFGSEPVKKISVSGDSKILGAVSTFDGKAWESEPDSTILYGERLPTGEHHSWNFLK